MNDEGAYQAAQIHRLTHAFFIKVWHKTPSKGVQRRMVLVVNFFVFFKLFIFCFVVAIFYLVHNVMAIFHLPYILTASGKKSFLKY